LQASAFAQVERKARARHLRAALEGDQIVPLGECPVRLRLEIERRLLAFLTQRLVLIGRVAHGHALVRHVRDSQERCVSAFFGVAGLVLQRADALFERLRAVDEVLRLVFLVLAHQLADPFRRLVRLVLEILQVRELLAPLLVKCEHLTNKVVASVFVTFGVQRLTDALRVVADKIDA